MLDLFVKVIRVCVYVFRYPTVCACVSVCAVSINTVTFPRVFLEVCVFVIVCDSVISQLHEPLGVCTRVISQRCVCVC